MRVERPTAILFDWDNTLIENWRAIQAALNVALVQAGRDPMDLESVKLQARHSAREIFPNLFGESWPAARAVFTEHFERNHLDGLHVMTGSIELLDAAADSGIPLGVVSNKKGEFLRREIAHLGWTDRFATIVGAQDAAADKPDPAPVRLALSRMGIAEGPSIWFVGDTDIDMRAAIASGCSPVLVGPGPADPRLMDGLDPVLRCHNCLQLAGFVRSAGSTISPTS